MDSLQNGLFILQLRWISSVMAPDEVFASLISHAMRGSNEAALPEKKYGEENGSGFWGRR